MRKIFFYFALPAIIVFSLPVNAQVFDLSSTKKTSYEINQNIPVVYKPSKLIIGDKTKFVIKAEPKSHVSLVTSEACSGAPLYYGQKLRLGQNIKTHEGIVGENGIIELEFELPEAKELLGKMLYFEVLAWKKADLSDLKVAKIMGTDARETDVNAVLISEKSKSSYLPGIGPGIPGTGGDMGKAMEVFKQINETTTNENSENYYQNEIFSNDKPLMLRNLRLPELNNTK